MQPPTLSTDIPIVVFGDDWGRHVSSMQHLFQHVARTHTVVWINAIGHRVPTVSGQDLRRAFQKLRTLSKGRHETGEGETVLRGSPRVIIHPSVLPWHHIRLARSVNARSLTRDIHRALETHGLETPPLLVTGSPPAVSVLGRLGERASVYYCMDDFLHLPNVSPSMLRPLEAELLDRVDAVIATAQALVDSKRPRSGRSWYLPQGVNFDHFAIPRPVPTDLSRFPRPWIGFAGGVGSPLVPQLINEVARANRQGTVVLVGPVRMRPEEFDATNVQLLGPRPYHQLPAYVQAFDVGLIPYEFNPHTVAVDPLKLLEYLAAGIPVVSTDLPEVRKYGAAIRIAPSVEAFVDDVQQAILEPRDRAPARQALARTHDWERRAERLLEMLAEAAA